MSLEKQTIYGWPVIIDLFLGGTGAGAFLAGFVIAVFRGLEPLTETILFAGPLLVAVGALFLFADITVRSRAYRLFSNPKSWTSRGSWILTIFMITSVSYALKASPCSLSCLNGQITMIVGITAALFAFLVLLYPGLLMGAIKAIPFWNTGLLPTLFLLSGLANGLVLIILTAALRPDSFPAVRVALLHGLGGMAVVLILLQAATLGAFLKRAARGNSAARESWRLCKLLLYRGKVFSLGFALPLALFLSALFIDQSLLLEIVATAAGIVSLVVGVYLRYAIIGAGIFSPRFEIKV